MIPKNIKKEHILKAIQEIDRIGTPISRSSKKFTLDYNGRHYSPKYVISLANKFASGKELNPSEFSGGNEANNFLKSLGFNVLMTQSLGKPAHKPSVKHKEEFPHKVVHNERCTRCKEAIRAMLEKIYGKVETNYKFEIGNYPEDFRNTSYYENLKEIYEALQNQRGFKEFIKSETLPNCDFFVPNPGFIVEFDETQHFTLPRKIALEHYPEKLELGFDRKRWMAHCERINAKDNDPLYRDEQRAWYDTLRDFLPAAKGLKPTVRLFAKDYEWCSLDPSNPSDVERFKNIIEGAHRSCEIKVKEDPDPFLARIIIADEWDGNKEHAKKLLEDICKKWPKGKKVKLIITCGGFIQFDWPESIYREDIGDNKDPNKDSVDVLVKEAEKSIKDVLDNGLREKLKEFTDYITLGIDSYKEKISTTQNYISQPHVELVCLIDLRDSKFYWTGKSYPTPNQEKGLVRLADLRSHFLDLKDVGKVMMLGCHDLTMFNNRNWENTGKWRKAIKVELRKLANDKKTRIVLHHPHTTVKTTTWRNAWSGIREMLPSVKQYAGAGRYSEPDPEEWDSIDEVLKSTKCGSSIDFVIQKNKEE
jgi:hypothetical protein